MFVKLLLVILYVIVIYDMFDIYVLNNEVQTKIYNCRIDNYIEKNSKVYYFENIIKNSIKNEYALDSANVNVCYKVNASDMCFDSYVYYIKENDDILNIVANSIALGLCFGHFYNIADGFDKLFDISEVRKLRRRRHRRRRNMIYAVGSVGCD